MTTLFLLSASAYALTDGSPLPAPALETRAQELFREIRCVVCAGQSIHDSGALVAHDMRALIRSQIEAGKSDTEIKHFLIERYGDEILMTPPLSPRTALLWLAPLVFLALGILITFALMRRRKHQANI